MKIKLVKLLSCSRLLFTIMAIAAIQTTLAQQMVSGTVTDVSGEPLVGANVLVKGTTNGTQTDFDGNYTISAMDNATLVISYIGFTAKEVAISGRSTINVSLEEDASKLDEVIVIGYGTAKRAT